LISDSLTFLVIVQFFQNLSLEYTTPPQAVKHFFGNFFHIFWKKVNKFLMFLWTPSHFYDIHKIMDVTMTLQGREITKDNIELVQQLIEANPSQNRTWLSKELCLL